MYLLASVVLAAIFRDAEVNLAGSDIKYSEASYDGLAVMPTKEELWVSINNSEKEVETIGWAVCLSSPSIKTRIDKQGLTAFHSGRAELVTLHCSNNYVLRFAWWHHELNTKCGLLTLLEPMIIQAKALSSPFFKSELQTHWTCGWEISTDSKACWQRHGV